MDDDLNRYMQFVETAAKSMKATIEELLQFSKIGKQPLHKRSADVAAIVEEVLRELEPEQAGREIEWTIELPHQGIPADPGMMKIIWINLLSNALKYTRTRSPARIAAGAWREDGDMIFFVRDNGVGFDMSYYDRLFAAFQRLHSDETFEGSGIGLATTKRIVQKHGGRIWAESKPDEGAGFYFSMPAGEDAG
jgi:two-component system, chemotaxis family, sensor kinase Cph1